MFHILSGLIKPFGVKPFQSYVDFTPSAHPWTFIGQNLRPFWRLIILSLLLTLISASLEVWLIGYAGRLVDGLSQTPPQELWALHGSEFILVMGLILIVRPLASLMRESINDIYFRPNAVALIRWRLHRYILQQSVGWFQNDMSGSIAGHVRDAGSSATGAAYQIIQTLFYVAIYVLGSIWLMATSDIRLVFPILIWLVIYIGLMIYAVPKFEQQSAKFQQAYAAFSGMLVDTYANIATVKLFSNPKHEDAESRQHFEATRSHFIGLQKVEVVINIGLIFIASLLIVGMVGFSVYLWQAGAATLGLIATSIALSFRISSMAEWLMDGVSSLFGNLGALRASLKIISQPLAIKDVTNAPDIKLNGGAIELKNLHHHYGKNIGGLNGLSLSIKAGEKIGLVGKSGVGKSTLVNLILRFHQAEQGQILIDGQDVSQVKQDSLRLNFGMVMQDASLLHRSIADNIAYGAQNITQAAIEDAAKKAHAHEFIMQLRDAEGHKAYKVQVGERGVKLSGGQRQRIALARVILKNAPILILDEATSALDSEVEAAIQQSLGEIMHGKTVIAIAHRLSTIAQMDRIIVLHDGQVAEQGKHDELLKLGGIYAQLWAMQSGGYIGN